MLENYEIETYTKAINKWGEKQLFVAIEEMSELQKELCKVLRGEVNVDHLAEEFADVEIMLSQMLIYFKRFGLAPLVNVYKAYKLDRLNRRIDEAEDVK